ncbi:related to IST2 [Lecanosticta acicola]|uniref:Related to IST2 n=1 Tax=Lecanosticta acicola TaxID=111012 RepID=A0AAI9EG30_9PEZI|nr:related to IST2 [Lecanosticta acicola]
MSQDTSAGSTVLAPLPKRSTFPRTISELVTTQLVPGNMAKSQALHTNMGVDYVIVFRFPPEDKIKAASNFEKLCQKLSSAGLATEARNGENNSVLLFVKVASDEHMHAEIYRSRVKDWIHGVRSGEPPRDVRASLEQDPLTDAERLRIIYQLITNHESEGGAGIKPKSEDWKYVESIFALHDHTYNKQWIQKWSTEYQVKSEDLDEIRDRFGEKVAFYFAFEQTYFNFLIAPTAVGFLAWLFLGSFSPIYAVAASLWSIVFVEWWKHQERDLAIRWGVRGVSNIESKRHDFVATTEFEDPATGETQRIFPWSERLKRQLLQLPFALAATLVLGSLICLCFAIEIFIGEVYVGPGKSILTFTPTVILTTCLPLLTGVMSTLAKRLNDYENYETESQYERSHTIKLFVLDFITSYLGIMLTAFVYVPFGSVLVPYLDVFTQIFSKENVKFKTKAVDHFTINPDRLRKQVIYFAVTASIINFAMEVLVPYLKRQGFLKFKEMTAKRNGNGLQPSASAEDHAEEKEFLDRVRSEAELPAYDVYTDLREMIIQFGYLSLFSVVWPLVPASYLVNNWFEIRADAVKICVEMQRPTPWRADTIGPWLDALSFLTWLGSITMAALTYMFSNDGVGPDGRPHDIKGWGLLLAIFFSEHLYLFIHSLVASAISRIDSPGRQKERRDRYVTRQKLIQDSLEKLPRTRTIDLNDEKPITRDTLEEEQRMASLKSATPTERFWARQQGWRESAQIGKGFIDKAVAEDAAKDKKEL